MEENSKENGSITTCMDKGIISGKMVDNILANTIMTKNMYKLKFLFLGLWNLCLGRW